MKVKVLILISPLCSAWLQEVILKRAADLVEALYGMPHNNQVSAGTDGVHINLLSFHLSFYL